MLNGGRLKWLDSAADASNFAKHGCKHPSKNAKRRGGKSVLSEAVHFDHVHLLQNSVLRRIIEEKWKAYGRRHAAIEGLLVRF